jgi:hydroxymethylpyrimidine pyrophosphatase-like HAD family hydrolase
MNRNATKWNGIKELLNYYKIDKENTVAFGDDFVDIEMIEKCGIGVAVENGIEEIKAKAKYICGKNTEDGIAKWIEKNILK